MPGECHIQWISERGVRVTAPAPPHDLARALRASRLPMVLDIVPADGSVLVTFDPAAADPPSLARAIARALVHAKQAEHAPRTHEIPVCYEPPFAPDLAEVARGSGLSPAEVVRLHTSTEFVVAFLGFAPGFGYLTGLPEHVRVPRLASPRTRVEAGSVGLAGPYTGVYALPGPGGWRVIGRTSTVVFDANRDEPALWRAGDVVRFHAISAEEMHA